MPRSVNKAAAHRKRRRILKRARGYWGARSKLWTIAKHHIEKGLQYAYRDRRAKKRAFRRLWIVRINAAARLNGTTYSRLIAALHAKHNSINRKVLADLAMNHPAAFAAIVQQAMATPSAG